MKLHIHFNNSPEPQICALESNLEVGQTATVHLHDAPGECEICPNGHCHAPNVSIARIDEETVFVALEYVAPSLVCEIKNLPPHPVAAH